MAQIICPRCEAFLYRKNCIMSGPAYKNRLDSDINTKKGLSIPEKSYTQHYFGKYLAPKNMLAILRGMGFLVENRACEVLRGLGSGVRKRACSSKEASLSG